ncbi:hypothetical protein NC651_009976 [Populus alba x Populus x berolinensis]|nr:hypothetical protein NC651_009976 [Populus alba x Populus x berolinensis]
MIGKEAIPGLSYIKEKKALAYAEEIDIPVFQRLTHLELKGNCVDLSSRAPHRFLQKLPHLDCLDFRMGIFRNLKTRIGSSASLFLDTTQDRQDPHI